jgi:hypothetical protein
MRSRKSFIRYLAKYRLWVQGVVLSRMNEFHEVEAAMPLLPAGGSTVDRPLGDHPFGPVAATGVIVAEAGAQPPHGVGVPSEEDIWIACSTLDPDLTRDQFDHDWGLYQIRKSAFWLDSKTAPV